MLSDIHIRFAEPPDHPGIYQLRSQAYTSSPYFTVNDEAALGTVRAPVLIAENNSGLLLATMQLEIIHSPSQFFDAVGDSFPPGFHLLPTLYTGREATLSSYRNKGLNTLLRLHALQFALQHSNIASTCSYVYQGMPRFNALQKMGYHFIGPFSASDHPDLASLANWYFIYLQKEQLTAAIAALERNDQS